MKALILASAVVLTGLFAGTAFGQCQHGGGGRGKSGGMQGQRPGMMSMMQGGGQSFGMNPLMAQAMMQQQALMQQAYMMQAMEKERQRQEKKERHIANVKQRKASEDARRAERRAQLVASNK